MEASALAIASSVTNDKMDVRVQSKFYKQTDTTQYNIALYLTEDHVKDHQVVVGVGDEIPFYHENVLRTKAS